jgi:hypothetical protein
MAVPGMGVRVEDGRWRIENHGGAPASILQLPSSILLFDQ